MAKENKTLREHNIRLESDKTKYETEYLRAKQELGLMQAKSSVKFDPTTDINDKMKLMSAIEQHNLEAAIESMPKKKLTAIGAIDRKVNSVNLSYKVTFKDMSRGSTRQSHEFP
jgi:hypothetical protein